MKKLVCIAICIMLALTLVACAPKETTTAPPSPSPSITPSPSPSTTPSPSPTATPPASPTPTKSGQPDKPDLPAGFTISTERNEALVSAFLVQDDMSVNTDEGGNLILTAEQPPEKLVTALKGALSKIGASTTEFKNVQTGVYNCEAKYDGGKKTVVVSVRATDKGTGTIVYVSY